MHKKSSSIVRFDQLFWPIAGQQVLRSLFLLVDMVFIAHLSTASLAAGGFTGQYLLVFMLVIFALNAGLQPLVLQLLQNKAEESEAKSFLAGGVLLMFICGLILSFFAWASLPFAMQFSHLEAMVQTECQAYLLGSLGMLPLLAMQILLEAGLRVRQQAGILLKINLAGMAVNLFLDLVLIFGLLGFPALGIMGAGLATSICKLVEMILICIAIYRLTDLTHNLAPGWFLARIRLWKIAMHNFLPLLLQEILWGLGFLLFTTAIARCGTTTLAGWQVINNLEMVIFHLGTAMFMTLSIFIGRALGNHRFYQAKVLAWHLLKHCTWLSLLATLIYTLCLLPVLYLFGLKDLVFEMGLYIGLIALMGVPFKLVTVVILMGIVRVGGQFWLTAICEIALLWLIFVPLVWFTGVKTQNGIYITIVINLFWAALFLVHGEIYRRQGWLKSYATKH